MLLTIQVDEKFHWSFESGREPADFWSSFHEGVNRLTGQPRCICKRCGVQFNHPKVKGSPASLSKHAKESCKKSTQYGPMDIFSTSCKDSTQITQNSITELVLKFFISGNVSFQQGENEYLQRLIKLIPINGNTFARCPSRKVIRSRLTEHADNATDDLRSILLDNDSKVSLALDCWTSRTNSAFLGTSSIDAAHNCTVSGECDRFERYIFIFISECFDGSNYNSLGGQGLCSP